MIRNKRVRLTTEGPTKGPAGFKSHVCIPTQIPRCYLTKPVSSMLIDFGMIGSFSYLKKD
jgi:hypothetical protein